MQIRFDNKRWGCGGWGMGGVFRPQHAAQNRNIQTNTTAAERVWRADACVCSAAGLPWTTAGVGGASGKVGAHRSERGSLEIKITPRLS